MARGKSGSAAVLRAMPEVCGLACRECKRKGFCSWVKSNRPMVLLLTFIIVYFIGGVVFYTQHEGWSFTESVYFTTVTVTSVGYGDYSPTTPQSRGFTTVFGALGTVIFTLVLGIRLRFSTTKEDALENELLLEVLNPSGETLAGLLRQDKRTRRVRIMRGVVFFLILMVSGTLFFTLFLGHTVGDAIYVSLITGASIGYGDIAPSYHKDTPDTPSYGGMWFGIVFMTIFFLWTINMLGWVAHELYSASIKFDVRTTMGGELTHRLVKLLDTNADGTVSRAEWLVAVLVANKVCHESLISSINQRFDELDVDGSGALSSKDIEGVLKRAQSYQSQYGLDGDVGVSDSEDEEVDGDGDQQDEEAAVGVTSVDAAAATAAAQ
eukprot:m.360486 g.360486  ORF g.360486 m.360486 type:complete len:380 (-) comp19065_c0_seq1:245-1384(-)